MWMHDAGVVVASFRYILLARPSTRYRADALSLSPPSAFRLDIWAHNAVTTAYSTNSLRRRCCRPTAHCNKSRDSVDLLKKIQRTLRPSLQHLASSGKIVTGLQITSVCR